MSNRVSKIEAARRTQARLAMLLGCTALAGFIPGVALAQSTTVVALPELTVTGEVQGDDDRSTVVATQSSVGGKIATNILNTPAAISVITAKEIERRNASTTEEVLQYTSGVIGDFYGADERFDYFKIRGLDANVYRDGMAVGRGFLGVREEPYAYERVEVLKGANSSAFGMSDPGGAVNYVTKTPKSERFGEVYMSGNAFGSGEIGGDFGDNLTVDDTLSYRLTGKFQVGNGEVDYSPNDESFVMAGLTWRPSDATELTVVYDNLYRKTIPGNSHPDGTDLDPKTFFGEPDFNELYVKRNTLTAKLDHDFGYGLSFGGSARYSDTENGYKYVYIDGTPVAGTVADRVALDSSGTREHFVIDGHLQYDASFGPFDSTTLVGTEYSNNKTTGLSYYGDTTAIDWTNPIYTGAPVGLPLIGDNLATAKVNGIYLQQDITFDQLTLSGGLRNDWISIEQTTYPSLYAASTTVQAADFSEFTKRLGASYAWTPEVSTYVSYGESAMPAAPRGSDVLTVDPERGEQWEVGVKYQPEAFPGLFTASVFDLTKTNITRTNPLTMLPETIGEVRVRGVDLEAKAEVLENVTVTAAYAYLMSEIVENGTLGNEGNQLARVPNHLASLWVDYTLPEIGSLNEMTFGLGARYTGAYYFGDENTTEADANVVIDAAFNYAVDENTDFQLNVSNLFDQKHVAQVGTPAFGATFYNPGRSITATLKHSW
ncbi:MAG: TonB-dependent siderophore receptor [Candidatus Devosia phytovorans]|uniref:TonB-dependent siderophore receptor n=1 Tax=Candidatus Devosia phytovorans TaxID=3121372 RepID=A0AAJ5VRV6_9HYPH|nr:TonB-dependent siderophore receptor [Devosia sp.]WEK03658.1 MAG: TonB-dependent siderophore receptor [Devosia sp.]